MTSAQFSVLLAETPTADEVKPGWVALVIVLAMGVALFFLMWSMIKQFRKVDFPEDDGKQADAGDAQERDERETNGSSQ